ncbi:flagellar filament capping protein FliD [Sphingomonas silueang]|uniref:flagellar filament capping protein FliD n=1 Tax=Sphingomonas silueang TaxID=3156617 RepID=UPI0032B5D45B
MATISSSTPTPTPAATSASSTTGNIAKSLGLGSGTDTVALVKSLVDAQFAGKTAQLTKRSDTLTAQISTLSEVRSGITGFAGALTTLVKSGTLATQLTSSSGMVKASVLPGARVSGTSATVTVSRLASAQVAVTRESLAEGSSIGTGKLVLELGQVDGNGLFASNGKAIDPIVITAEDSISLQAVADKITAAKAGVTASVVSDAGGQRLVLKGATGAAQAFTLTAQPDTEGNGLERLNVGFGDDATGARLVTRAGNAEFTVDGVDLSRDSNSVTGAIPGVRLELNGLTAGVPATIGTTPPTDAITQAVNDFVATFNGVLDTVQKALDPKTGALRSDSATATLKRSLQRLTLTELTGATDGSPTTLAQIGIATNNDGTLRVETAQLARALNDHPAAVEAMFVQGTGATGKGLSAALNAISLAATDTQTGLGATSARYTKAQQVIDDEKAKITRDSETASTRMTQQFAASEARVAAYKAQQAQMETMVKMWTADR